MFTLPTRWRTNTLDRLSPAAAAEGQNDVLASLAATILRYRQEAHFRWGKTLLEITRPLQRVSPQVLIGYTEVAARRHVTNHVTST